MAKAARSGGLDDAFMWTSLINMRDRLGLGSGNPLLDPLVAAGRRFDQMSEEDRSRAGRATLAWINYVTGRDPKAWENLSEADKAAAGETFSHAMAGGAGTAAATAGAMVAGTVLIGTRFIDGVKVVEKGTGRTLTGTVDVQPTLDRIASGVKDPHRNDGMPFKNNPVQGKTVPELPVQPLGYYTEYVVRTPGFTLVGPQRVVVGLSGDTWYTPNHYDSFIRVK